MQHTHVVSSELKQVGFSTYIFGFSGKVFVSLKNRKVSRMEVEQALDQAFGEIKFNCLSTCGGVLVDW